MSSYKRQVVKTHASLALSSIRLHERLHSRRSVISFDIAPNLIVALNLSNATQLILLRASEFEIVFLAAFFICFPSFH